MFVHLANNPNSNLSLDSVEWSLKKKNSLGYIHFKIRA